MVFAFTEAAQHSMPYILAGMAGIGFLTWLDGKGLL